MKPSKPIQYASAYFVRLEELRPLLKDAAVSKWKNCKIVEEIVNVKPTVSALSDKFCTDFRLSGHWHFVQGDEAQALNCS